MNLKKPFANRRANLLLWVVLIIATLMLAARLLNDPGSRVGPPYETGSGGFAPTATPQPTATPGAGGNQGLEPWIRNQSLDVAGSQDIALWHVPGCVSDCRYSSGTGFGPGLNDLIAMPIYIGNSGNFGEIALVVDNAIAATTARVGIYEGKLDDTTHNVYVGDLVEDYGTIDTSTVGFKQRLCTSCAAFTPGLYFVVVISNDASVRFERLDDGNEWAVPYGVFSNGTENCPGLEVDNFPAAHTALPATFPTPGPAIQCAGLTHSPWMGVELN